MSNACPAKAMLDRFNIGDLSPDELEGVSTHISNCTLCASALDDLQTSPDSFLAELKDCLRDHDWPETLRWDGLAGRAVAIPRANRPRESLAAIIGNEFGSYRIVELIGRGGMGVVYKADQLPLNRTVALKMIRAMDSDDPQAVARFRVEAEAVARLKHANVVEIYEFGQHEGQPYFSMEFVEGESLSFRLKRGPLEEHEAARLAHTLARTVAVAHERRVLHRDLKPSNIILTPDGAPKIMDFGLAKLMDSDNGHTASDAILGTPSYMAPEQASGHAALLSERTDVYALGAILYECLTGSPAFKRATRAETLAMVRRAGPKAPRKIAKGLSRGLEAICLKCLEKDPKRRYASAAALGEDLERWLEKKTTHARPRFLGRVGRTIQRHTLALSIAAIALCAAVFLGGVDADRPLARLQADLENGKAVTLVPEKGAPAYFRILAGDEQTKVIAKDGSELTVQSWGLSLIELAPRVPQARYRFECEVRHETSDLHGQVGLFLACRKLPTEVAEGFHFVNLRFNEVIRRKDIVQTFPKHIAAKLVAPEENPVSLAISVWGSRRGFGILSNAGIGGAPFKPRGGRADTWRKFAIEVTPEGLSASRDGNVFGPFSAEAINKSFAGTVEDFRQRNPDDEVLANLSLQYAPEGAVGVYVHRGSASFRSARLTPLPYKQ